MWRFLLKMLFLISTSLRKLRKLRIIKHMFYKMPRLLQTTWRRENRRIQCCYQQSKLNWKFWKIEMTTSKVFVNNLKKSLFKKQLYFIEFPIIYELLINGRRIAQHNPNYSWLNLTTDRNRSFSNFWRIYTIIKTYCWYSRRNNGGEIYDEVFLHKWNRCGILWWTNLSKSLEVVKGWNFICCPSREVTWKNTSTNRETTLRARYTNYEA